LAAFPNSNDVIIIDDDPSVLDTLEMYCENCGFFRNVIKAKDGSEASKKMANQKFALILMDINMPKKTGVDLVKEFDKEAGNDPDSVIVVSGELSKQVIQQVMVQGVKNFLVKPFDEDSFVSKVKSVLKRTRPDLLRN
jgi:two-component system, chemotaxis family, chemotaxis protein CheY